MKKKYTYRVTWSEEDQEHVGLCVEFPSLSYLAEEEEAPFRAIRTVVADEIADIEVGAHESRGDPRLQAWQKSARLPGRASGVGTCGVSNRGRCG